MKKKPKIAFYWCASCGGCEESVIDLAENLLTVSQAADIVFWPVAIDARYEDIEAIADGDIDAALINGAIRLDAHLRMARLLRRKAKRIIAHGTCAHLGGVIGLANLYPTDQLMACAYSQVPSMADPPGSPPGERTEGRDDGPSLPALLPAVRPLDQVIAVDAVIPGCPPPPVTVEQALMDAIHGRIPETSGTVYAHRKSLCHECPRLTSKPDRIEITHFKRLYETRWDADACFLPQGLVCLGPATRGGCSARCITANMPCRGCFGPTDQVADFGGGAIGFIAAMVAGSDDASIARTIASIPDPAGLIYRYSLAASVAGRGEGS